MNGVTIARANETDIPEILAIQRLAFQSEARLLNDDTIQPLHETKEEAAAYLRDGVILKALDGEGTLVGSVRGIAKGGIFHLAKLSVHPDEQGKGIARMLLEAIQTHATCPRMELFTNSGNPRNVMLYKGMGFTVFAEKKATQTLTFVYMEKEIPTRA